MKKFALLFTFSALFLTACVSIKVSPKNNYNYSVLENNAYYIIETKSNEKLRHFQLTSQTDNELIGIHKKTEIQIKKANIESVKKPSTGKTIGLVAGSVAVFGIASVIPAAVSN